MGRGLYKRKIQRKLEAEQKQEQEITQSAPEPQFKVKVNHPSLRMRRAPDAGAEVVGLITDQSIYDIFETLGGWGKLDNGAWIMLQYTQQIR